MVAYVLEKFGINDIRVVDGGLAGWQAEKTACDARVFRKSTWQAAFEHQPKCWHRHRRAARSQEQAQRGSRRCTSQERVLGAR